METVRVLVNLFYLYLLAGVIFAVLFLWRGIDKIDDATKGISWKTRALFFPGLVALWPVFLKKWKKSASE